MRKLVLSGFLASEEIYINQLEALLLVSLCSGVLWSPCGTVSCSETAFGVGEEQGPGPVLPREAICGTALLTAWHWAARVIARKELSPSALTLRYVLWESQEKKHNQVWDSEHPRGLWPRWHRHY